MFLSRWWRVPSPVALSHGGPVLSLPSTHTHPNPAPMFVFCTIVPCCPVPPPHVTLWPSRLSGVRCRPPPFERSILSVFVFFVGKRWIFQAGAFPPFRLPDGASQGTRNPTCQNFRILGPRKLWIGLRFIPRVFTPLEILQCYNCGWMWRQQVFGRALLPAYPRSVDRLALAAKRDAVLWHATEGWTQCAMSM